MGDKILTILDQCLDRMRRGETLEQCLADYPDYRAELEPLLSVSQKLLAVPRVSPSAEFRQTSPARLMARLRTEAARPVCQPEKSFFSFRAFRSPLVLKAGLPVALVVLAALIVWLTSPLFMPAKISAGQFTLSVLNGSAEVQSAGSNGWSVAKDGMNLKTGSRVKAADGSSILLTFFDGSTTKLESGAEVLVVESDYPERRSAVVALEQVSGLTWSHVAAGGDDPTHFSIGTPQGQAEAAGTAFSVDVEGSQTLFAVAEGSLNVTQGSSHVHLAADQQVMAGDAPALPAPVTAPAAQDELLVSTALPGISSVSDPGGASTGYFPDGLAFNQISNSKSSLSNDGQQILIRDPASGDYVLTIRRISDADIPVSIQARRGGQLLFQYSETLKDTSKDGWIIRIKLDTTNAASISGQVVSVEALSGKTPEKVVETNLAKKRAVPIPVTGPDAVSTTTIPSPKPVPATTTMVPSTPAVTQDLPTTGSTSPVATPAVTLTVVTPVSTITPTQPAATVQPTTQATKTVEPTKTPVITKTPVPNSGNTAATPTTPVTTVQPTTTPNTGIGNNTGTTTVPPVTTTRPAVTPGTGSGTVTPTKTTPLPTKTNSVTNGSNSSLKSGSQP